MFINNLKLRWKQTILLVAAALGMVAVGVVGIYDLHQAVHEERRIKAREIVDVAIQFLERMDSRIAAGELTAAEAWAQAIEGLRTMHYGENGYFWVQDQRAYLIVHPYRRDLENTSMLTGPDPFLKIVAEETLKHVGDTGGFITYEWPKPGSMTPAEKISYVRRFAP